VPSVTISDVSECDNIKEKLNYPLVVKPNQLGSSIGIAKVFDSEGLERACLDAFRFGSKVIVEMAMSNFKEINCACFRDSKGNVIVSQCEMPLSKGDLLSFDDKYKQGGREFPALLEGDMECKIRQTTALIYEKLNMEGVIRIDYFVTKKSVYVNEINTVPGSLAYYLFCERISDAREFFCKLIDEAIAVGKRPEKKIVSTGILSVLPSLKK
jgi:D-alanine-D-alanine ligase